MKRTKQIAEQQIRDDLWESLKKAIDEHKIDHLEWSQNGSVKSITVEIDTRD